MVELLLQLPQLLLVLRHTITCSLNTYPFSTPFIFYSCVTGKGLFVKVKPPRTFLVCYAFKSCLLQNSFTFATIFTVNGIEQNRTFNNNVILQPLTNVNAIITVDMLKIIE